MNISCAISQDARGTLSAKAQDFVLLAADLQCRYPITTCPEIWKLCVIPILQDVIRIQLSHTR